MSKSLVTNRLLRRGDAAALQAYFIDNKLHFKSWEPARPETFASLRFWQDQVAHRELEQMEKIAAYWIAVNNYTGAIVAHCSLTNVIHGVFKAGYMGYAADVHYQGKGITKRLCLSCIDYAFNDLDLNRIIACHMPKNTRSQGLLKKLGFEREGFAKKYLKIDGQWEDHVLTALINPAT